LIRVFCSYAHEDVGHLRKLVDVYLKPLRREQLISHWDDRQIVAGQDWQEKIDRRLEDSDLVLLLISNDFVASDYTTGVELKRAMERRQSGSARVIPILLEPVSTGGLQAFASLQMLPALDRPISKYERPNEAYVEIVDGLEESMHDMLGLANFPADVAREMRRRVMTVDPAGRERFLQWRTNGSAASAQPIRSRRGSEGYVWPLSRGEMYWSNRGRAHPTWGATGHIFHSRYGGPSGLLGFPVYEEVRARPSPYGSKGMVQRFEESKDRCWDTRLKIHYGASIYWKSDDGATFATHGRIGAHFESLGGSGGGLGFPLSEEKEVRSGPGTGGRYQEFEGGRIYFGYVDGARAIEVVGDLGALHQALDGAEGRFGFPTAPATTVPNLPTASVQEFEGGTLAAMSPADSS
jgi:hypothetical protein